jgi:hypothetical protein
MAGEWPSKWLIPSAAGTSPPPPPHFVSSSSSSVFLQPLFSHSSAILQPLLQFPPPPLLLLRLCRHFFILLALWPLLDILRHLQRPTASSASLGRRMGRRRRCFPSQIGAFSHLSSAFPDFSPVHVLCFPAGFPFLAFIRPFSREPPLLGRFF